MPVLTRALWQRGSICQKANVWSTIKWQVFLYVIYLWFFGVTIRFCLYACFCLFLFMWVNLLRSASSADVVVPSTRHSTIGDRAFAVAGPRTWNSLPSDIRTSTSFNTFKKHLKSYLFKLSFLVTMCTLTMYVMRSRSSSCSLLRPINCQIYITLQDCYREIHN